MHGDFSRVTFRPGNAFTAVLAQQGRVQLDADINEQAAIQSYLERIFVMDLIGRHAGPRNSDLDTQTPRCTSFEIVPSKSDGNIIDLTIGAGRYYVDGIMIDATKPAPLGPATPTKTAAQAPAGQPVRSPATQQPQEPAEWTYWIQPFAYLDEENEADHLPAVPFLVYLKVWERFVTAVEDPDILETALGAALPDTCGRVKACWQVLPLRPGQDGFPDVHDIEPVPLRNAFDNWADQRTRASSWMAAQTQQPTRTDEEPCVIPPDLRFRGLENQLYRIEVHQGGNGSVGVTGSPRPTFKWSRENGSVVFPAAAINGAWVTLAALGRDDKLDLHVGDWVEVVDDAYLARGAAQPLLQVLEADVAGRRVRLSAEPGPGFGLLAARHPYLRRWDHQAAQKSDAPQLIDGALEIKEEVWIDLEDGVQIWFKKEGEYHVGDYWQVPARTLTGEVEWPRDAEGTPQLVPPAGIAYHYAPLAWITSEVPIDLRQQFRAFIGDVPRPT